MKNNTVSTTRRIQALFLAIALVLTVMVFGITNAATRFTDVADGFWAREDIEYVVEKGLFNGTSATTFAPQATMTRGQLTAVLYRYAGEPSVSGKQPYSDVTSDKYYYDAAIWANKNGIMFNDMKSAKQYNPNESLTRAEFAVMLYKFSIYMGDEFLDKDAIKDNPFTDMDAKNFGTRATEIREAMLGWAYPQGVLNGTSGTTMAPKNSLTRAHVAAMLHRYDVNVLPGITEDEDTPDTTKEYTMSLGVMNKEIKVGDYTYAQCLFEPYHNDITVKFTSSNTSVATVESYSTDGAYVYAKSAGTATITATAPNGEKDSVTVTVVGGSSDKPDNNVSTDEYDENKQAVIDNINAYRAEDGLGSLSINEFLMDAAQVRAEECASMGAMNNHIRPDGTAWSTVLPEVGYIQTADNAGGGEILYQTSYKSNQAASAVNWWRNSPGHNHTMTLDTAKEIGVGIAKSSNGYTYYCAIIKNA